MTLRPITLLALLLGMTASAFAQDAKKTTGDIKDLDFLHAKFHYLLLEAALKSKQPDYPLGMHITVQKRELPDLIKKYPDHADLKKWLAAYEAADKNINKNADPAAEWTPEFAYWANESYRQAWVSMALGKMEEDDKNWFDARVRYNYAVEQLTRLADHEDDWMKKWPDDIKKWVKDTKPIAEKKAAELKDKN